MTFNLFACQILLAAFYVAGWCTKMSAELPRDFYTPYYQGKESQLAFDREVNVTEAVEKISDQTLSDTTVYMIVQVLPAFVGGNAAMQQYIQSTSRYPVSSKKGPLVQLRLLIEKDGSVSQVKTVYTEVDDKYVQEAKRVLETMPNWVPGSQDGRPLRSYFLVPIRFTDAKNETR
jgi:protein TonB